MRHPTTDNEAARLARNRSEDRIWQMPSKEITLPTTSSVSSGRAGKYMESRRLNFSSVPSFSLARSSSFRIGRMRSSDA